MSSIGSTNGADTRAAMRLPDRTPRDWLDAGQSLLKRGGLKALKLRRLAAELGVSTGSFYHHFTDFDAYQGRLADYFAGQQIDDVLAAVRRAETAPRERIRLLARIVARQRLAALALAMRAWAESDARARDAVDRHDDIVLAFLADCLGALGFAPREASVRAFAIVAVGLGTVHAPDLRNGDLSGELLHILLNPVAG